jgi:hypothetical protein
MCFNVQRAVRLLSAGSLGAIVSFALLLGCSDDDPPYCYGGDCVCGRGAECSFVCDAPPCTMTCAGNNPHCVGECANGNCECGSQSTCDFECAAPPCHVTCNPNSNCLGTCANGSCECMVGASCEFACQAGPCHVNCDGQNKTCRGVCANGTCHCDPGSTCDFECKDGNCKVECVAGASCILRCPRGDAGAGCDFNECAAPTVCSDGLSVACNAACPTPASRP